MAADLLHYVTSSGRRRTACAVAVGPLMAALLGAPAWGFPGQLAAAQTVPVPKVTGPIPSSPQNYPFFSAEFVGTNGYVEEEFFFEGTARQFVGGAVVSTSPYKTRLVVRRPADAGRANGTTVLEWTNVTGGYDQEFEWITSHGYFMRSGTTWVGVSNQVVGVNDLKRTMPRRYGSLSLASDSYSEDVFSQAAAALLTPSGVDPLAGSRPRHLVAAGHSQSGTNLSNYYNNIQPLHGMFDGFMPRGVEAVVNTDTVRVPVIRVQTETNVTEGSNRSDTDKQFYRRWEVAGTSHADRQQQDYREPRIARDRGGVTTPYKCLQEPFSRIPFQHVLNAAYAAMTRWLETGKPPAIAPRWEANAADVISRDERGNSLGAIRLPQHAVPTALNSGDNAGAGFCVLYGAYQPFSRDTLLQLYGTQEAYRAAVERAAADLVRQGFLLPEDAATTVAQARAADLGLPTAQLADGPGPAVAATTGALPAERTKGDGRQASKVLPATGGNRAVPTSAIAILLLSAVLAGWLRRSREV